MSSDGTARRSKEGDVTTEMTGSPITDRTREELLAEIELLRERNQRLRTSHAQTKQTQYRRTALGLTGIGLLAIGGGVILSGVRDVLLVFGATGLFGAVLTYYLTPEQFVAADVGLGVYSAVADDRAAIVTELGLSETHVYVPLGDAHSRVRLFVPQFDTYSLPPEEELQSVHVVVASEEQRGVTFRPTGEALFDEFSEALGGTLDDTPATLAPTLTEALVEQFGLVGQTRVDLDADDRRVTVAVSDSVYGSITRIDHPVVSFVAVGLARGLGRPVTVETRTADDDRDDYHITCRWKDSEYDETGGPEN